MNNATMPRVQCFGWNRENRIQHGKGCFTLVLRAWLKKTREKWYLLCLELGFNMNECEICCRVNDEQCEHYNFVKLKPKMECYGAVKLENTGAAGL